MEKKWQSRALGILGIIERGETIQQEEAIPATSKSIDATIDKREPDEAWGVLIDDLRQNGGAPLPLDWRDTAALLLCAVLLTLYYYYGRPSFFEATMQPVVLDWLELPKRHHGLLRYGWWAVSAVGLRILVPLAFIVWVLRGSPGDYGFRLPRPGHGRIYLAFYGLMLPLLVFMSFQPSFQAKYPLWGGATASWSMLALYELCMGVQFAALEAFFRGFLVFALFRRFGYQAVVVMTIPYCMIHFGKPIPETLGAIVAGLALGYMALKSRSWLPGALLHWSVGATMDLLCALQEGVGG